MDVSIDLLVCSNCTDARVPIGVNNDDFIGRGDVEAHSTGFGADQEDKLVRVGVEVVDGFGTKV